MDSVPLCASSAFCSYNSVGWEAHAPNRQSQRTRYSREIWPFLLVPHTAACHLNVLEMLTHQFVELPLGHGSESFVCWSEHCEGSWPVQVLCQTCRLDCSHQRTAKETCIKCFTGHSLVNCVLVSREHWEVMIVKSCWGPANQITKVVIREEMSL